MKKIFFTLLLIICCTSIHAQKIYQTKAGKIKFFSATPIEDIEATNSKVDTKLATNGQVIFQATIRDFSFDNELMKEDFNNDYMQSSKYPKAVFMGNITNVKEVDFTKDGTYKTTIAGTLELHGVKNAVTTTATIDIKAEKLTAKTVFKIKLSDYKVEGLLIGSKVADNVEITVDCKYD